MKALINIPEVPASYPNHPLHGLYLQGLKNLEELHKGNIKDSLFRTDKNGRTMSDQELFNTCFKSNG